MAFSNEEVSAQDRTVHGFERNAFYLQPVHEWTIDRERDMFLVLRSTGSGPESSPGSWWAFHWQGKLIELRTLLEEAGGDFRGGHGWELTRVLHMRGIDYDIQPQRRRILRDLKEALEARKGLGLYSTRTSYEVVLQDSDGSLVEERDA